MLGKKLIKAAAGAGGVEKDEYFNQTTLLLHGDGNQGANNFSNAGPPSYLAFSDNSSNDFPITVNGDAYGTPFSPYSLDDGYWSVNTGTASGNGISFADNAALQMGTGNFTIEGWFRPTATGNIRCFYTKGVNTAGGLIVGCSQSQIFCRHTTTTDLTYAVTMPSGFNHIAWVRNGSTLSIYLNGVSVASATVSFNQNDTSIAYIGAPSSVNNANKYYGDVSNFRIVKGRAVYTSNFTPSTSPLGDLSGGDDPPQGTETSLLIFQSNRFKDNSSNAFSPTVFGTPAVKTLNPFNATVDGTTGSGYLIGTGNYLTVAETSGQFTFGTGDYEYSFWIYPNDTSTTQKTLFGRASNGNADIPYIYLTATTPKVSVYYDSIIATGATTINPFEWTYVVISRVSGTTRIFVNGVLDGSGSDIYDLISPTTLTVGNNGTGSSTLGFPGYIADARIRKGYGSTSVTVPTTTSTAETGTQLLTCQYQGTVRNVGFIDSSPNNFPITRNGNTTQGSFSPFSADEGKWSVYFDGNDYLRADTALDDLNTTTSPFTLSFWIYPQVDMSGTGIIPIGINSTASGYNNFLWRGASIIYNDSVAVSLSSFPAKDEWTFVEIIYDGSDIDVYHNGSNVGTASSVTFTTAFSNCVFGIGCEFDAASGGTPGNYLTGYMSNLRLVAAALSPSSVPSTPTSEVSSTTFLGLQSNRFVDNSTTPKAITIFGNTSIQSFSPFAPSAAYDPSVNGGSAYFDGTTDWLSVANDSAFDMAADDFTIEGWFYQTTASGEQNIFGKYEAGQTSFLIQINAGTWVVRIYYGSTSNLLVYNSAAPAINQWCHFALERNGANNEFYVNGVRLAQVGAQTMRTSTAGIAIGALGTGYVTSREWDGYLSSLRIVKGRAVYDGATYTIPTAPLTATSGGDDPPQGTETSLLCNFTNAGIYNNALSGGVNLETVGNAQVNTDSNTVKFGTGSMKFDGTGDYLRSPYSPNFQMKTGDFTVEFWVYLVVANNYGLIFNIRNSTAQYSPLQVYIRGTRAVEFYASTNGSSNSTLTSSTLISLSTWTHVAVVRSSGTVKIYIDGVADTNTLSLSGSLYEDTTWGNNIGGESGGNYLNGLIDDLRITKGVARYTANFTPPDKAFPDQ